MKKPSKRTIAEVIGGLILLGVGASSVSADKQTAANVATPTPQIIERTVFVTPSPTATPTATATETPTPKPTATRTPKPTPKPTPTPEPTPALTRAQENAIEAAESYLSYTAFSRSGLIEQLKFEGYSGADATFAVDAIDVNWKKQAWLKAEDYLDYTSFSHDGLVAQLKFDGFTTAQAEYGVRRAGL
jgi:hypothetical protein